MKVAGEASEGFVVSAVIPNKESSERHKSFQLAFQKRWNCESDPTAAMSYDAVILLVHLLRQDLLGATSHRIPPDFSLSGVTGELRFDPSGNRVAELGLEVARRGRFETQARK